MLNPRHGTAVRGSLAACVALFVSAVMPVYAGPYMINDGGVDPEVIWKTGLGRTPDVARGRIRLRAFGDTSIVNLPLDVLIVTDNSGSMGTRDPGDRDVTFPSRIQGTYNACVNFVNSVLDTNDRIAHMRFCAIVDTVNDFRPYDEFDEVIADFDTTIDGRETVDGVRYRGTAIWTGIHMAAQYAAANRRPGTVPVVIAMTDGEDNASGSYGDYYEDEYPNLGTTQRSAVDSVITVVGRYDSLRVFTVNLGNNSNSTYMQEIAAAGNGEWNYSADGADMDVVFQDIGTKILKSAAIELSSDSAMVLEVLRPGMQYVPGSWGTTANNTAVVDSFSATTVDSLTVLQFFVDNVDVDEVMEVTYDFRCDRPGRQPVNYGAFDFNPQHLKSQVQYKDPLGNKMVDYFATQYVFVMDTLISDSIAISATAVDTDQVMVTFDLTGAADMLLDTLYLYWSTTDWVTSTASPGMAIDADTLAAWGGQAVVQGLTADTKYYFTVSGRNYFGDVSDIVVANGDTATTFDGSEVAEIRIACGATEITTAEAAPCTAYGYDETGTLMGVVSVAWTVEDGFSGNFVPPTAPFTNFFGRVPGTARIVGTYQDRLADTVSIVITAAPSLTDSIAITATATDTDRVDVDFSLTGMALDDIDTLYLYWSSSTWVTNTGSPGLVIDADTLAARGNRVTVDGLVQSTVYYFTVAGHIDTGSVTGIDPARGDTARTFTGGAVMRIDVVAGASSITTVEAVACTAYGYNGDNVLMGTVAADWTVSDGVSGRFVPASGPATVFSGDSAGTVWLVATYHDSIRDSVSLQIMPAPAVRMVITDSTGAEVGNLTLSADNPGITLYAQGIDSLGRPVALQDADWAFGTGDVIGTFSSAVGGSTVFDPQTAGSNVITALYNLLHDSTGTITVTAGAFAQLVVTIDTAAVTAGDSLAVVVTAVDGAGNPVSLPADLTWQLPPGISATVETTGTDTFYVVPTGTGSGRVVVSSPSAGVADTSAVITVGPDEMSTIEIGPFPDDTLVMFLDETREFTVTGYDRFGNSTGPQVVRWDTTGNLGGTFTGLDSAATLTYTSGAPGLGRIIAVINGISDTITVRVVNQRVTDIRIVWRNGTEAGDTAVSADDDSLEVVAYGYNSADSLLGAVTATWAFVDPRVGYTVPVTATSVKLIFVRAGSSAVTAVYQAGIRDTSGVFTVEAGAMDSLVIVPAAASIYLDDTLTFQAVGLDADGNRVDNPGTITWTTTGHAGSINATSGRYAPDTLGRDTVYAASSLDPRFTAVAYVVVNTRPGSLYICPERYELNAGESVACTLVVLDYLGQAYDGPLSFDYPLVLEALAEDGDSLVSTTGTCTFGMPWGDETGTATVDSGYALDNGRLVFELTHDRIGEGVYIRCVDTTLGIGDTTDRAIIWLDPSILADVYPYPSPVNFNRYPEMTVEYRMRYEGTVTVRIISAMGALAYEEVLDPGDEGARSGVNRIAWDGRNRNGKNVGSGAFLVRIKVETDEGTMEEVKKVGVIGRK